MKCYIVGAGDFFPAGLAPEAGDFLIAADGGYRHLPGLGLVPDLIIGDFDSLDGVPEQENVVRLPKEKNDTDMLAALRLGLAQGYRDFRLYGGTGGRPDHSLANVQCLAWLSAQGARGELVGDGWTTTALTDGALSFPAGSRGFVSVFCHGDRAEGVTLEGLKYPLTDALLRCDFPLGVSNEFTGAESRIRVRKGTVVVMWQSGAGAHCAPLQRGVGVKSR